MTNRIQAKGLLAVLNDPKRAEMARQNGWDIDAVRSVCEEAVKPKWKYLKSAQRLRDGSVRCVLTGKVFDQIEAARKLVEDFEHELFEAQLHLVDSAGNTSRRAVRTGLVVKIIFGPPPPPDCRD